MYRKLQSQLDSIFPAGDSSCIYDKVRDIPYLDAVINETLRLKPAVPSGQPRVTPPDGLQIDDVWIPGDINVITPQYVIQRDERNFPRGEEYVPERWLAEEKKTMILHEQAFFPFQIGESIVEPHWLISILTSCRPVWVCRQTACSYAAPLGDFFGRSEFRYFARSWGGWCFFRSRGKRHIHFFCLTTANHVSEKGQIRHLQRL